MGIAGGYQILSLPIAGDTAFKVVDGSPQYSPIVRANSTYLFGLWALTAAHITRVPRVGGSGENAVNNVLNDWIDYDVDETLIFTLTKTVVSSVPVLGGSPTAIVAADGGEIFTRVLVADANRLAVASERRLFLVSKVGGAPTSLATGPAYGIVSDGQSLFYFRAAVGGGGTCSNGSSLYAIPLIGGREQHLATEPAPCVSNVIQDGKSVYWLPGNGKTIHKVNK